jgi:hypothetical protein
MELEKELIKNNESDDEEDEDSVDSQEEEELSDDEEQEQENINVDEKKKRGRKPKPKEEEVDKIKKKRGRKPKVKEEIIEEKKPKKRGRKPKEKIYSVKELPKTFFEENKNETLILHLPIKPNEKMENPHPEASNNDTNFYNINNNEKVQDQNNLNTQSNLIEQNNIKVEENNGIHLFFDNDNIDKNIFNNSIKEEINSIIDIKPEYTSNVDVPIDSKYEDDCKNNRIIKKNLKNIMYEFINANSEKKWPESTNIHCWWCCNSFNDIPCALPEYYKKDKFYVNGCFCSFNCCASYNFSRNDDSMWERYSLLNLMYKKLYNKNFVKINLAPPRETLKMFGGFLSIEEFREYSIRNDKSFNIIKPPLISIIPKIEENIYINKTTKTINQNTNESILNKTQNTLKLKRNKPITNPNSTLQSFMDFKII